MCGPCKVVHIVVQSYWVNAFVLFACSIFCFFDLPTQLGMGCGEGLLVGGLCLVLSSIMYVIAGVNGEKTMSLAECQGKRRR